MVIINENDDIYSLIRENNAYTVRLWLDNVTNDIHQSDEHGFTLLHWAAWYGRLSIVQLLLQRGARMNAVNRGDDTPLHLAASHNHFDIVQQLIKNKAHINTANIHGNTPLHYACFHRYLSIAKYLIETGHAFLYVSNRYGQTPLNLCSSEEMCKQLSDLAKEQGQVEQVIPYEENNRFSIMPMFDIIGSSSTKSVIDIRELHFENCLYSNHRHEMWQAMYNERPVMAKVFKLQHNSHTPEIVQHEIDRIKVFNSLHLLLPFGICHDSPNVILLTQYLFGNRNLFQMLHKTNITIDSTIALKIALDIGRGMAFLHGITNSFRPQFILNSHHVMINEEYVARLNLADCHFSFESNIEFDQSAWLAPEVLEHGIFTNASDIWSFAIILWELFTRRIPFNDLTSMQCGLKIVQENLRLPATGISPHIDKLIHICTHNDPTKRPSFDAILPIIEKIRF